MSRLSINGKRKARSQQKKLTACRSVRLLVSTAMGGALYIFHDGVSVKVRCLPSKSQKEFSSWRCRNGEVVVLPKQRSANNQVKRTPLHSAPFVALASSHIATKVTLLRGAAYLGRYAMGKSGE